MPSRLDPTNRPQCDILHLAYGGLGGHRAVVEELSKSSLLDGLRSGVLYVLPTSETDPPPASGGIEFLEHAQVRRRGDFSSMYRVFQVVYKRRPTCIIAHTHRHIPAAWLGQVLGRRRPKIILVEHQSVSLRSKIDDAQSLIGAIFSTAVVFLSKHYEETYRNRTLLRVVRRQIAVIPNGIDISAEPIAERPSGNVLILGMASRLIPSKKIVNLIQAVELLCEQEEGTHRDWILRIAGDGPDRQRLQTFITARALNAKVLLEGPIDRSQMANWYQSINCYVHISDGESFGMSLIEAASFGIPVVASDDEAFRQIFEPDRSIVLIPSSDPETIATYLREFRDSGRLREVGAAAREVVRNRFSNDEMALGYLRLLGQIKALRLESTLKALEMRSNTDWPHQGA